MESFLSAILQPINFFYIVSYILWGGSALSVIYFLWELRHSSEREFGLAALILVAWLDMFALLSGFSIGWLIAIVNTLVGLLLCVLVTPYRREIAFASFISLVLVLSLRGTFSVPLANWLLPIMLALGVIFAIIQIVRQWSQRNQQRGFGAAVMALLSCLGGSILVWSGLLSFTELGIAMIFLMIGISLVAAILSSYYRWQILTLGAGSFVWLLFLLLQ